MTLRVRFAPSPSGDLHVGNARTALFNYLYARKSGGRFIFRLEDSDADRSDEDAVRAILSSLEWLGLRADEGLGAAEAPHPPYRQSEAAALYRTAAEPLLAAGRAYWCYDTLEEQEAERARLHDDPAARKRRHPHRDLDAAGRARLEAAGRRPALRFATDDLRGQVAWEDRVRGPVSVDLDEIRDFNLLKSDGTPMYNFACVVDDHRMGITVVLRGEDGISNTPRQLLLYGALGWTAPAFSHVSFILGPDGQKLSKRHGDTGIGRFRARGYLPEAVLNYLGLLGLGGDGEGREVFSLEDLVGRFDPGRLVRKAAVFDYGKLDFLNGHWLRSLAPEELHRRARPFLEGVERPGGDWTDRALDAFRGNAVVLEDFRTALAALLRDPEPGGAALEAARAFARPKAPVEAFLAATESWPADEAAAKAALKAAQVASGLKGKDFFIPLRIALTGVEHGPEFPKLLDLLGPERSRARLRAFLNSW